MIRHAVLVMAVLLTGRAHADRPPPPLPTRAATAAALLVAADDAAARDTRAARRALARTLTMLDRLGVHDDGGDDDRLLDDWRRRAASAAVPVVRGRVLGPAYRRGWLDAGREMRIRQLFVGGVPAEIAVAAAPVGAAKVTISVEDEVAGDRTTRTGAAECDGGSQCRWLPLFTQRYTIVVRNRGLAGVRYYLVMD